MNLDDLDLLYEPEPPVSAEIIDGLENDLNVKFPPAYKDLLKLGDGISLSTDELTLRSPDGAETTTLLCSFLSIADDMVRSAHEDLLYDAEHYRRRLRVLKYVIPFAEAGDGWLCFDYRKDRGRKNCSISEYNITQVSGMDRDGLIHIADSFDQILAVLPRK